MERLLKMILLQRYLVCNHSIHLENYTFAIKIAPLTFYKHAVGIYGESNSNEVDAPNFRHQRNQLNWYFYRSFDITQKNFLFFSDTDERSLRDPHSKHLPMKSIMSSFPENN